MIKHNAKIYLCRPDRTVICALNGVQIKSVEYEQQLKDFNRLTFNVDRYIDIDGEYVESAGYEKLKDHMTIYLEGLDYFNFKNLLCKMIMVDMSTKHVKRILMRKPLKIRI